MGVLGFPHTSITEKQAYQNFRSVRYFFIVRYFFLLVCTYAFFGTFVFETFALFVILLCSELLRRSVLL